jgi:plasmid stabilization system protein ParE
MNYAVKILTPADADTVEAALWYDAQLPGLGAEFMAEVNTAAQRLTDSPEIHRVRFAEVRRAPVKRFKFYGLYYLIQNDEVWVIAVHHGRRHPRWLRERRRKLGE